MILIVFVVSILVYVLFSAFSAYREGVADFKKDAVSIQWTYYLLALLAVFLADVIAFPKWYIYCKRLNIRISTWRNFMLYMSLNSMNIVPGRWGRAIASYLIRSMKGNRIASTFPAVVVDIFTDFLGFGIVAIVVAFLVNRYLLVSIVLIAILLLPFIFLFSRKAYRFIRKRLDSFKRLRSILDGEEAYFQASRLLGGDVYLYSLAITIPSTLLSAISLMFVMLAFGVPLTISYIPSVFFVYCTVTLLGMASGIPGSFGIADISLLGLLLLFFQPLGVDISTATLITIFTRIATLWWGELYGFGFLAYVARFFA